MLEKYLLSLFHLLLIKLYICTLLKVTANLTSTVYMPNFTFNLSANWNISYTNDLFWLYNPNENNWISYKIFEECALFQNTIDASICDGEIYTSPLGNHYTSSSTLTEILSTVKGCDSTLTINLTVETCMGINDLTQNLNLTTYPNPTTGNVTFSTSEQISSIEIYNLTGQKVATFNNTNTIDISSLPKGMYTAKVTSNSKVGVVKLIKE